MELAFAILPEAQPVNWDIKLLLARDLKLLQPDDYEQLSEQTIEIERMLITVVLVQKLTAERSTHTASESSNGPISRRAQLLRIG